jgi:hypothetical protein
MRQTSGVWGQRPHLNELLILAWNWVIG